MGDSNTVLRPSGFPGTQEAWERYIASLLEDSGGDPANLSGVIGILGNINKADDGAARAQSEFSVDDFFMEVAEGDGWQEKMRIVETVFRSVVARSDEELGPIYTLRLMSRITPESQEKPFTNVFVREGKEPVEAPNIPSILAGVVPAHVQGENALNHALRLICDNWYDGDFKALAADIGYTDPFLVRAMFMGLHFPRSHMRVVQIAEGLGIDPHKLDILWFADRHRKRVGKLLHSPFSKSNRRARARLLNRLATARLGEKYRHRDEAPNMMQHYLDMASFIMRAGIHPQTVISVVAAIDEEEKLLFRDVVPFAEELNERGKPWKAAIVSYLAANHMMANAFLPEVRQLVHLGNAYIVSGDRLPDYLTPEHAGELRDHYLWRGLELLNSSPVVVESMTRPSVLDEGLGARFEDGLENMTGARRRVLREFRESSPELWRVLVQLDRADIVNRALAEADPEGEREIISHMSVVPRIYSRSLEEGVIGENFGRKTTKAELIKHGTIVYVGGAQCMVFDNIGIVPMLPIMPPVIA